MSKKDEEVDVDEDEKENELDPLIIEKYKTAGGITNNVLSQVIGAVVPGKTYLELAELGDNTIKSELGKVYNKPGKDKQPIFKSISFPTTVGVNECIGNLSPEAGDTLVIPENAVVKIDLGCNIDGYIANAAYTTILSKEPVTDVRADVITAVWVAADVITHMLRPGVHTTLAMSSAIHRVADAFGVSPVDGVLSHSMKRFVIDGNKVISNILSLEKPIQSFVVEVNDVFCIDVVMSTGTGKVVRESDKHRPTIFKRAVEESYMLKLKTSRQLFQEVSKTFGTFPFSIRSLQTHTPRVGLKEMTDHRLLVQYPALFEKEGAFVAQCKVTCLVTSNATLIICGGTSG
jgi:methionyl aminopeptidase